ncbi:phosphoribosyltransferase family protein [Arthrobacter sp. H5]|uniref:phosphoribosyltransferase n=1 Tax=Arthrobacter sp. H5 TaxID=1267973 RepID=UPI000486BC92|nr:phosphoribosyltransferase family protein [Arthrobacter sp. H5]
MLRTHPAGTSRYADRLDAARLLADALDNLPKQDNPLVLGLPRGGVPVAAVLADRLGADMDVIMVRKVGVPGFPELAMGAIAAVGGHVETVRNPHVLEEVANAAESFAEVSAREQRELDRRELLYRGGRPPVNIAGRCVVIVDDGVATGATMRSAIAAVRALRPAAIIATAPVFLGHAYEEISKLADQVVCPWVAPRLGAVGQAYQQFTQVSDEEVQRLLGGGKPE